MSLYLGFFATKKNIVILLAIFVIFVLYFLLLFDFKNNIFTQWLALRRSKKKGPKTSSPVVPIWLQTEQSEGGLSSIRLGAVLIQQRSFSKTPVAPLMKPAIIWAQWEVRTIFNFLKRPGDHSCFELPSDTCTLSVPMKNFKCGDGCTDFQPTSGTAPGAFYSFQMLGEQKIQLVHYHENNKAYPAGVVIYIEDPYADSFNYDGETLREFVKNSNFHEDPAKERQRQQEGAQVALLMEQ